MFQETKASWSELSAEAANALHLINLEFTLMLENTLVGYRIIYQMGTVIKNGHFFLPL